MKFGPIKQFDKVLSNYLYIPNYNKLFQFKSFGVVFLTLVNLICHR